MYMNMPTSRRVPVKQGSIPQIFLIISQTVSLSHFPTDGIMCASEEPRQFNLPSPPPYKIFNHSSDSVSAHVWFPTRQLSSPMKMCDIKEMWLKSPVKMWRLISSYALKNHLER